MYSTRIVTSFLSNQGKFLILRRSPNVKSMKGLWGGISGVIERKEDPFFRAKKEILEEVGISEKELTLVKTATEIEVQSLQYANHKWIVFPFLFSVQEPKITLNWENSEYKWIDTSDISKYQIVPSLDKVLASLL